MVLHVELSRDWSGLCGMCMSKPSFMFVQGEWDYMDTCVMSGSASGFLPAFHKHDNTVHANLLVLSLGSVGVWLRSFLHRSERCCMKLVSLSLVRSAYVRLFPPGGRFLCLFSQLPMERHTTLFQQIILKR